MIICIWRYAGIFGEVATFVDGHTVRAAPFRVTRPDGLDMTIARFMASMMMHINVERDVQNGLRMMKYAVNHHENFTNPYAAWLFGFLVTVCSLCVEFDVMIILTSIPDIINVINKYVSLAAIVNIPRFYYASIKEHKFTKVNTVKLKITNFRHDNPLKNSPW